ncbi:hypothetical protein [Kineosporia succinea]|uniref:Uncharacterized protein n=1 Tax=Kineosporia succinea TaxID=84632 RepID=A0ABT9P399_9ACTN|nr:hypothetical protein [Kineosporia succinea]MDP9827158.1 hypothetical protein [Kineosporia succinea]
MTGSIAGNGATFNTLVASGGSDGGQGGVLLVIVLVCAVVLAVVNVVSRFQQPFVVILQNPFKFLMKTIMFGVTMTVLAVAVVSFIIATAGVPS